MGEVKKQGQDNHNNHDEGRIKLFGAMITLQRGSRKVEEKDTEDDHRKAAEKRAEKIIACPRCNSMDTKFCYFNNYNVNQPRHFCKGCQRYWTAGGALRNVPIGAGRRKAKPPCREAADGGCGYEESVAGGGGFRPFGVEEGLKIMEEWHAAISHGGFRQLLPAKRPRNAVAGGQPL